MTPFMHQVVAVVDGGQDEVVAPATRPSVPKPVSAGADEQVAIRSLAEQLVCEANAVLAGEDQISLVDEVLDGRLGFTLRYRMRCARVQTQFWKDRSLSRLLGDANVSSGPQELKSADELENMILLLLGDPDKSASPLEQTAVPERETTGNCRRGPAKLV